MNRLVFVDNYSNCSKLLYDLHVLTTNSSYVPLSVKFNPKANDIFICELCCVDEIVNRFNIQHKQIIGVGHDASSYVRACACDELLDYIIVDKSLLEYSIGCGIARHPRILQYGLHVSQYHNVKKIGDSFNVGFDSKVRIPYLDVQDCTLLNGLDHSGIHAFILEDLYDIRTIHEAICFGALLVSLSSSYMDALSKHGFVYTIPNECTSNIDYSLSLVLEYIRTNPKIHVMGSVASYRYATENIDWSVAYTVWKSYFNGIAYT